MKSEFIGNTIETVFITIFSKTITDRGWTKVHDADSAIVFEVATVKSSSIKCVQVQLCKLELPNYANDPNTDLKQDQVISFLSGLIPSSFTNPVM